MAWLAVDIHIMSVEDDDSMELLVQPPKEEKAKITSLLSSWEFQACTWEPLEVRMFMVISDVYLKNLMQKAEEPRLTDPQRKRLGHQCLIWQELDFDWITQDGATRDKNRIRGQLVINYLQYRGLQVVLRLGELHITQADTVQAKILYYGPAQNDDINYKTFIFNPLTNDSSSLAFLIDDKLFDTYFRPKLSIEITVKKQQARELRFRGIQNEGNTCYMNSTLQILYFLRPLRKTLLQFDGKGPLMEAIKRVFVELLDSNSDGAFMRPVDASQLLSAYGRFPDPRKQQDIHQFLLGFLDQLENECPQLKQLWLGHGHQVLNSRQPEKPYSSSISEQFNELDLLLEDHLGNTLGRFSQSVEKLLVEEHVDDKIESDDYGKVEVTKTRIFSELPKVMFFNLKRYKYRKDRNRLVKILTDFQYPPCINLGFLQGTPTGLQQDYVLFGVAVHRGQAYNSGHYFSFVNTSPDPNNPHWIKFNDSFVHLSSVQTVLGFTGGKRKTVGWSKEYERFIEKEVISEQTAYLLVYIRRDKFRQYQSIPTPLPLNWMQLRRKQIEHRQGNKVQDVQLLVLDDETGDLYDEANSLPIALNDDEEVHQQLARINQMLGCRVASVWKVHRQRKKIKQVVNYIDLPQTPARLFDYKRGHAIPDYLLVVPESHQPYRSLGIESKREKFGIVTTLVKEGDAVVSRSSRVVGKESLQDFKNEEEKRLGKKGHFQDKDRFVYDWTDHCTIIFD